MALYPETSGLTSVKRQTHTHKHILCACIRVRSMSNQIFQFGSLQGARIVKPAVETAGETAQTS